MKSDLILVSGLFGRERVVQVVRLWQKIGCVFDWFFVGWLVGDGGKMVDVYWWSK